MGVPFARLDRQTPAGAYVLGAGKGLHVLERATGTVRVQANLGTPGQKIGFDGDLLVLHDERRVSRVTVGPPRARVQLTSGKEDTRSTLRVDDTGGWSSCPTRACHD